MQIRKNRCDAKELRFLEEPLEQEYSGQAEGESDLKYLDVPASRRELQNQVGSQLLLQL